MLNLRHRRWTTAALLALLVPLAAHANEGDGFDLRRFLAPFHSVVLHYPIGFVTLAGILELFTLRGTNRDMRFVTRLVMGLGAVSAIIAAALGWFRAAGGGYENTTLESHRFTGTLVTVLAVGGYFLLTLAGRDGQRRGVLWSYRALLAGCLGTLVIAGHQGGNLTHGSNYLFEGAPDFIKAMLTEGDSMSSTDPVPADEKQKYFLEQVQPIFEQKCYSCHGEEKQKGGYRLDKREVALKGGDSEKTAIKPGDPMTSHLVNLILLPPDHDDVMPPSGKSTLTPEEIGRVVFWIKTGAVYVEHGTNAPASDPGAR